MHVKRQTDASAQARLSAPLSSRADARRPPHGRRSRSAPGAACAARGCGMRWRRKAIPHRCPACRATASCDVAIVGGGYMGLWTALQLKERAPELEVVLLEQDICGGGPSGRNGGFVNAWWDELDTLVELYGAEPALMPPREALSRSVASIGTGASSNGVDAHYRLPRDAGRLHHAARTTTGRSARWRWRHGWASPRSSWRSRPDEVQARCRSPQLPQRGLHARWGHRAAGAAGARPATRRAGARRASSTRQSRRSRALQRTVSESACMVGRTRLARIELTANQVVLAVNAWAAGWRPFHRSILAWGSYMVRVRTASRRTAWRSWAGPAASPSIRRASTSSTSTSPATAASPSAPGAACRATTAASVRRSPMTLPPPGGQHPPSAPSSRSLRDVRLTDAWGGPIDVSGDHLPRFGTLKGGGVHYALGYSGNGVAPSHLAGRVLAALALGSGRADHAALPGEPATASAATRALPLLGARDPAQAIVRREAPRDAGPPGAVVAAPAHRHCRRRLGYHLGPEP